MSLIEDYSRNIFRLNVNSGRYPHSTDVGAKSLKVSTIPNNEGYVEVPLFALSILNHLASNWEDVYNREFYLPLVWNHTDYVSPECKSTNPLLKTFWDQNTNGMMLNKRRCVGTTYYGNTSILLYENFNPLFMFTLIAKPDTENHRFKIQELVGRVNPLVFINDDILAKYIRTHLIKDALEVKDTIIDRLAYYFHTLFYIPTESWATSDFHLPQTPIKFIVEDMGKWLSEPTVMDASHTVESINAFLRENVSRINDMII